MTYIFGHILRKKKMYTLVVKNCSVKKLVPIVQRRVGIDSFIYTDGFKTYDDLVKFRGIHKPNF